MQFKNALNPILLNWRCFFENWIPFRNLWRAGKLQFFVSAQQFVLTTSNQTFFAFVKEQKNLISILRAAVMLVKCKRPVFELLTGRAEIQERRVDYILVSSARAEHQELLHSSVDEPAQLARRGRIRLR